MPNKILHIINQGESEILEFKLTFSKYGTGYVRLRNWLKEYPNLSVTGNDESKSTRVIIEKQNAPVNVPVNKKQKKLLIALKQKCKYKITHYRTRSNN